MDLLQQLLPPLLEVRDHLAAHCPATALAQQQLLAVAQQQLAVWQRIEGHLTVAGKRAEEKEDRQVQHREQVAALLQLQEHQRQQQNKEGVRSCTDGREAHRMACAASGDDDMGSGADRSFTPRIVCPHCGAKVTVGQEEGHLKACSAARGLSEAARQHRVQVLRGLARGGPRRGGARGTRAMYVEDGNADADTELDPDSASRYRAGQASGSHGKVVRTAVSPNAAAALPTAATTGNLDSSEAGLAGGASIGEVDGARGHGTAVALAGGEWLSRPLHGLSGAGCDDGSGLRPPPPPPPRQQQQQPLRQATASALVPGTTPSSPWSMHPAAPRHQGEAWHNGAGGGAGGNGAPSGITDGGASSVGGSVAGPGGQQAGWVGTQQQQQRQQTYAGGNSEASGAYRVQAVSGNGVAVGHGHGMGAAPPAATGYPAQPSHPMGYSGTPAGSNGQAGPPPNAFNNPPGGQQFPAYTMHRATHPQQQPQQQHTQQPHNLSPQQQPYPDQQQSYHAHQESQRSSYTGNGNPPSAFPPPPGQWRPQGNPGPGVGQGHGWAQGPAGAMHGPGPDPRVQGGPGAGPGAWQAQAQGQGQGGPAFGCGDVWAAGGRATAAAAARPPVGSAVRRPVGAPIGAPGDADTQPLNWMEPSVIDEEEAGERGAQPLDPRYKKALEARMVRGPLSRHGPASLRCLSSK